MPYRVRKIMPLDLDERKAIGIAMPFSSPSVFSSTYQTIDAYKVNILNFLMTAKKERYFNVTFGNDLVRHLFENYSDSKKATIEHQLRRELGYYFPKVEIVDLQISDEINNSISLYIKFNIKNTGLSDELVIEIQ